MVRPFPARRRLMPSPTDPMATNEFSYRSWMSGWMRWIPTSPQHLEVAEKRILSYVKRPYEADFVELPASKWMETSGKEQIWTIVMNRDVDSDGKRIPLVLLHGFASGVGLWALNLDALASNRPVYAFDLLGFGRSSRPTFSSMAHQAEHQLVQSVEAWREAMKLERFVLLGHSMGGFLAASYALQHPDRVAHLILADPWGFPEKPATSSHHYQIPAWAKVVTSLMQPFNPLAGLRAAGPWGPRLVDRFRPDLKRKFEPVVEDTNAISNYIYHCNAQIPSGESAFKTITAHFGWAKHPMINRMNDLHEDVPITFIYGSRSWIDRQPGLQIKCMRVNSYVDIQVIQGAGHHVYADRPQQFHQLVQAACDRADLGSTGKPRRDIPQKKPTPEEVLTTQSETCDNQPEKVVEPEML